MPKNSQTLFYKNNNNNDNYAPNLPAEIIEKILSHNAVYDGIAFFRTCKKYYENHYVWRLQISQRYGLEVKNPSNARLILISVLNYVKYKNNKKERIKLLKAISALAKMEEEENCVSLFLSEAYLLGYGYKIDLKIGFSYLTKAIACYKANSIPLHSFILHKLANAIYCFQNKFVDFIIESNINTNFSFPT